MVTPIQDLDYPNELDVQCKFLMLCGNVTVNDDLNQVYQEIRKIIYESGENKQASFDVQILLLTLIESRIIEQDFYIKLFSELYKNKDIDVSNSPILYPEYLSDFFAKYYFYYYNPDNIPIRDDIIQFLKNDNITDLIAMINENSIDLKAKYVFPIRCNHYADASLAELSALYGSMKCFKYLFLNNCDDADCGKYAIIGGNFDIFRLIISKYPSHINDYVDVSIITHRYDIYDWLIMNYQCEPSIKTALSASNTLAYLSINSTSQKVECHIALNAIIAQNITLFRYVMPIIEVSNPSLISIDALMLAHTLGADDIVDKITDCDEVLDMIIAATHNNTLSFGDKCMIKLVKKGLDTSRIVTMTEEVVKEYALKYGPNNECGTYLLKHAVELKNYRLFKWLIDQGADCTFLDVMFFILFGKDVEIAKTAIEIYGGMPSALAMILTHYYGMFKYDVLKYMVEKGYSENDYLCGYLFMQHLYEDCLRFELGEYDDQRVVDLVLSNPSHFKVHTKTPMDLIGAIEIENLDLFEKLLKTGSNPSAICCNGYTCMHAAAYYQNDEIIDRMLELGLAFQLSIVADASHCTPMALSQYVKTNRPLLDKLIEAGGDLNTPNSYTPLMMAVFHEDAEMVKYLLEKGADPNIEVNVVGTRALSLALANQNTEIIELLIAHGAKCASKLNNKRIGDLSIAILNGMTSIALNIIERGLSDETTSTVHPIAAAQLMGNVDVLYALINRSTDPIDVERGIGFSTPLKIAVQKGDAELVRLLLEKGASKTATVPLVDCKCAKFNKIVFYPFSYYPDSHIRLLSYSFSPNLSTIKNTPYEIAERIGTPEIRELLGAPQTPPPNTELEMETADIMEMFKIRCVNPKPYKRNTTNKDKPMFNWSCLDLNIDASLIKLVGKHHGNLMFHASYPRISRAEDIND